MAVTKKYLESSESDSDHSCDFRFFPYLQKNKGESKEKRKMAMVIKL